MIKALIILFYSYIVCSLIIKYINYARTKKYSQFGNSLIEKKIISTHDISIPISNEDFTDWNLVKSSDYGLMDEIYNHLRNSNYVFYILNDFSVTAYFNTEKWGIVYVYWMNDKRYFEFGVYQTETKYNLGDAVAEGVHKELSDFISELTDKWKNGDKKEVK